MKTRRVEQIGFLARAEAVRRFQETDRQTGKSVAALWQERSAVDSFDAFGTFGAFGGPSGLRLSPSFSASLRLSPSVFSLDYS